MFSLAYVILPFSSTPPADAIRASLARFQRGSHGDVPDSWLAFHDETQELREEHEARLSLTEGERGGVVIEGAGPFGLWHIDLGKLQDEMRRRGLRRWDVRFADEMSLDEFAARFAGWVERQPETGAYGRWLNPLGHWDWWDLGGRYDGFIVGERQRTPGRRVARVSSGEHPRSSILGNIGNVLSEALGQEPIPELDVQTDQNLELVSTLLEAVRAGLSHALPGVIVLPPDAVEDRLRWIRRRPRLANDETVAWLGLSPDASWEAIVTAAYARFQDHWAAAVAFHH